MKKIVLAPDSFKGTLSAGEVCEIWQSAAERRMPDALCIPLPLSDGGEGLADTFRRCLGGEMISARVTDPLGRTIDAGYLLLPGDRAVIEVASASGLTRLTDGERDIMRTSTYGTGELINHAIQSGARQIILGLGGSATNDGGLGAAIAMGLKAIKADGSVTGEKRPRLTDIRSIDASKFRDALKGVKITIACDVTNPLCGPAGASAVYGPQKGATAEQVQILDGELRSLSALFASDSGKQCADIPGCGAAGGFALPFLSYGNVTICSGIDIVLDTIEFDRHLDGAALVISGEGRTDAQSAMGKVISGVAGRAGAKDVPVIVLSGAVSPGSEALYDMGVLAMFPSCTEPSSLENALSDSHKNLQNASDNLFRMLSKLL